MERVHQDMMTDAIVLQQQLQSNSQLLRRKEAELTRAEEIIRREQQQIQEMVSLMTCCLIALSSHYAGRDYQERALDSAGQRQGASSGTAATETTETAGNVDHLVYYEKRAYCEHWTTDYLSVHRSSPVGGRLMIWRGS